jgi:hypothetical protein
MVPWCPTGGATFWASSSCDTSILRSRTNARMISTLTRTARWLRSTSKHAREQRDALFGEGIPQVAPRPTFEITVCDLKTAASTVARRNMKSAGNRSGLRRTAWMKEFDGNHASQQPMSKSWH